MWSPCASANNAACGWLHGRHATAAELLRDALCPVVVVFLARLKFLPVIEDALAELSGSYRQWIESYGLRDMPVAANVPKGGGGTWPVGGGADERAQRAAVGGDRGGAQRRDRPRRARGAPARLVVRHDVHLLEGDRRPGEAVRAARDPADAAPLYKKLRPVFAHHHGRLAASPLFGATMFNQQAALFDLVPRDRLMFTEEKVDLFLRMRTAGLPYTLSERASEERHHAPDEPRARAENQRAQIRVLGGPPLLVARRGCICCSSDAAVAAGVAFRAQRDAAAAAAPADGAAAAAEAGRVQLPLEARPDDEAAAAGLL